MTRTLLLSSLFAFCLSLFSSAHAQPISILPDNTSVSLDEISSYPAIRLTPDKSEIIRLPRDATTVLVGNPNHLSILAESSTMLVLIPKAPGASHFTVLDINGDIIMQRHAIISIPKEN